MQLLKSPTLSCLVIRSVLSNFLLRSQNNIIVFVLNVTDCHSVLTPGVFVWSVDCFCSVQQG
jgi:hypothetical protein